MTGTKPKKTKICRWKSYRRFLPLWKIICMVRVLDLTRCQFISTNLFYEKTTNRYVSPHPCLAWIHGRSNLWIAEQKEQIVMVLPDLYSDFTTIKVLPRKLTP